MAIMVAFSPIARANVATQPNAEIILLEELLRMPSDKDSKNQQALAIELIEGYLASSEENGRMERFKSAVIQMGLMSEDQVERMFTGISKTAGSLSETSDVSEVKSALEKVAQSNFTGSAFDAGDALVWPMIIGGFAMVLYAIDQGSGSTGLIGAAIFITGSLIGESGI